MDFCTLLMIFGMIQNEIRIRIRWTVRHSPHALRERNTIAQVSFDKSLFKGYDDEAKMWHIPEDVPVSNFPI